MKKRKFTTREMALLIGTLVYTFPGVQFGPLFYRNLEFDKDSAFKSALGNLEGNVTLSPERITDLIWWVKIFLSHLGILIMEVLTAPSLRMLLIQAGGLQLVIMKPRDFGLRLKLIITLMFWSFKQLNWDLISFLDPLTIDISELSLIT